VFKINKTLEQSPIFCLKQECKSLLLSSREVTMKLLVTSAVVLILILCGCGDESTGPNEPELTPSVLSLVFSGDSSKVLDKGECRITVSWTGCTESSFLSYTLYRSDTEGITGNPSGAEILGVFTESETLEFIDDDVNWGDTYHYAVKTSGTGVDSVWSNEASLVTPGSAPSASVLQWAFSETGIDLDWTSCSDSDFESYRLFRSTSAGIPADTTIATVIYSTALPTDTTFSDDQVSSGVYYYYAVLTTNNKGFSSWSNEVEAEALDELPAVQDLQIADGSGGRTVILEWAPVQLEIEGYLIFFKEHEENDWTLVGTAADELFSHEAVSAGYYSVMAYKGGVTSSEYSEPVSTMPSIVETTYTIYDNYAPANYHNGFIFGAEWGQTGFASSSSFYQDIYAHDDGKGDNDVSLYSGNYGVFGNGYQSYFQEPAAGVYSNCDPEGTWIGTACQLYSSDEVVFVRIPYAGGSNAYAKMFGVTVEPDPNTNKGTSVSFSYEYQSEEYGFTLFTDTSR